MIDGLLSVLAAGGLEPTARELRDALWLAEHIAVPDRSAPAAAPEPPAATTPDPAKPSAPPSRLDDPAGRTTAPNTGKGAGELYASGGRTELPGVAARSPAVPALRGKLALVKALRPLKRRVPSRTEFVVDEDATARRIADEDLWVPVFRPAATRWLNLTLVVDAAPSMVVWRRTVAELRALANQLGAFRQVREFVIDSSVDPSSPLAIGSVLAGGSVPTDDPATLIDPTGCQAVLVVTDAVGGAWRDGRIDPLLRLWGSSGPTAVVTVLPQRMWGGTGLRAASAELRAPTPGMANREWRYRLRGSSVDHKGPIPVLELSSRWLASWAGLVAGGTGWRGAAVVGPTRPSRHPPAGTADDPVAVVSRFRAAASPTAFRLACYLSATWLNLPVMRLVQRVMLPNSRTAHLAEVFLGGLLRRGDDGSGDPEQAQYEFIGGVREVLNDYLLREDLIEVLRATTEFVADRFGQSFDFAALLADPEGAPLPALGAGSGQPLAYVAATVLAKLGGRYRTLIDRLGELTGPAVSSGGLAAEVRFTREHTWLRVVDDEKVRVGVTSFGWRQLGQVVRVRLPDVGTVVTRDEPMGVLESISTVMTLRSPVGGLVAAVNPPEQVDVEQSGGHWLVEIDGVDLVELDTLLTSDQYDKLTAVSAGPWLPDPARSCAVLIGYRVVDELAQLRAVLTDEALVGLRDDRCETLLAPDSSAALRAVEQAVAEGEDLLLVCVSGAGSWEYDLDIMRSRIAASTARTKVLLVERPGIMSARPAAAHLEIHGARGDEIIGRFTDLIRFGIPDAGSALTTDDIVEGGRWTETTEVFRASSRPFHVARNPAEGMGETKERLTYLSRLFEAARKFGSARLLDWTISDLRARIPLVTDGPLHAEATALLARSEWALFQQRGRKVGLVAATETIADAVREYQWLAESDPRRYRADFADMLVLRSVALSAGGHGEQAWESASRAVEVTREITNGEPSAELANMLRHLARLGLELGKHDETLAAIAEAVEILRPIAHEDASSLPVLGECLAFLGACATALGQHTTAVSAYGEAVELYASSRGPEDPTTLGAKVRLAEGRGLLGELALDSRNYQEAELRYREALEIWAQLVAAEWGNDTSQRNLCIIHERLGDVARAKSDMAAAEASYRDSLAIAERLGIAYPDSTTSRRRLSDLRAKIASLTDGDGTEVPRPE